MEDHEESLYEEHRVTRAIARVFRVLDHELVRQLGMCMGMGCALYAWHFGVRHADATRGALLRMVERGIVALLWCGVYPTVRNTPRGPRESRRCIHAAQWALWWMLGGYIGVAMQVMGWSAWSQDAWWSAGVVVRLLLEHRQSRTRGAVPADVWGACVEFLVWGITLRCIARPSVWSVWVWPLWRWAVVRGRMPFPDATHLHAVVYPWTMVACITLHGADDWVMCFHAAAWWSICAHWWERHPHRWCTVGLHGLALLVAYYRRHHRGWTSADIHLRMLLATLVQVTAAWVVVLQKLWALRQVTRGVRYARVDALEPTPEVPNDRKSNARAWRRVFAVTLMWAWDL